MRDNGFSGTVLNLLLAINQVNKILNTNSAMGSAVQVDLQLCCPQII